MAGNCEACVLKALKSRTKKLSLDNKGMKTFPLSVGRLDFLETLSAKNNDLFTLPEEVANLKQLTYLNLGSNKLQSIPVCVCGLPYLQTLHLFNNSLSLFPNQLPRTLVVLNLNGNNLTTLSPYINQLASLKQLSISNNSLSRLPAEICSLYLLEELHLDSNRLISLPQELGKLINLKKLLLQKNNLTSIPSSIGRCKKLLTLDVSGNRFDIFPSELKSLSLQEIHFENNPLLPFVPVPADQCEEVLPLKEVASRIIVSEMVKDSALMSAMVSYYPTVQEQLNKAGNCAMCGQPFVSLWLDCVQFELPKKIFKKLHTSSNGYLPLRAQLCSYKCFNTEGHKLFGIAQPPSL